MEALEVLHTRVSAPRLEAPAPTQEQLSQLYRAAFRANDHALLRPWRFIEIKEEKLVDLGLLYEKAALSDQSDLSDEVRAKYRAMPLRAPLMLVAVVSPKEHEKVPEVEQILSTGGAIELMMAAAHAVAVGAMWRTGPMAYHPVVKQGLGLKGCEHIAGFIYLGTPTGKLKKVPELEIETFVTQWP